MVEVAKIRTTIWAAQSAASRTNRIPALTECARRLFGRKRSDAEQLFDAALQDDDVRGLLHGGVIALLEIGTVLAGAHDIAGLFEQGVGYGLPGFAAAGDGFVDLDNQSGNLLQPGEVGVAHDESEEVAGSADGAVGAFVFGPLPVQEQFVLFEQQVAKVAKQFLRLGVDRLVGSNR